MTKKKKKQAYERVGRKYSIEEVIPYIGNYMKLYDEHLISMKSQRYQVFSKSCTCVDCGIKGKYFVKERSGNAERFHFNLYGVDKNGEEVLMTKDHIIPKSKGGKNTIDNYQTMCTKCNTKKGDKVEGE